MYDAFERYVDDQHLIPLPDRPVVELRRETFHMSSGVKIVELTDALDPQRLATIARWPADEYGDVFGMAFPNGADVFRDTALGEELLARERRRFEVHNPCALWCDWDACWSGLAA